MSAKDGVLTRDCFTAYWIAFGPHGPRSLPPPGENWTIFYYTMIGVAVSGVIFGIIKYFARGPASTMTKEHQEASNERMKVRIIRGFDPPSSGRRKSDIHQRISVLTTIFAHTGTKDRAHHRYQQRKLRWLGNGAERIWSQQERVKTLSDGSRSEQVVAYSLRGPIADFPPFCVDCQSQA